ncbi:hypothetical protein MIMGU_mgv1a019843mg, partial [Erythranthe guttata]
GNTTILFNHLLRAHTTLSHESKPVATIKTFFSSNNYYENNSAHKKELDKALTRMIAIDMQPFRIVEDRGFRDFVYYLNPRYILPSRTTLRNVHLQNMYNEMKEKLVLILNNVEYCAVTTDSWTSRANEFYVTVTCHFIDKNFVLREAVLSTNKLDIDTDHTSNKIADSLRAVLLDWNILYKTSTIVTDNAANMIKACEILKKRHLPCLTQTFTLKAPHPLTADDINIMKDLVCLFMPFDTATTRVSSSSIVTISEIIPTTVDLYHRLHNAKLALKTAEGIKTYNSLIDGVNRRLAPFENRSVAQLATIFEPRFKKEGFGCSSTADAAGFLLQNEIAACSSYENPTPDIEEPPTHPDYPSTKTSQIYAFVQDKIAQKQSRTPQADGIILVRQYLEKPHELQGTPPLEYWKYLCIPACSTASERMFSKAGCILSDRRAALKPFIVDQLLFTNKNQWLNE